ncbi:hypothetical protein PDR5_02500 [Pseudomonas sp. DR 5-09]|nr:hypothetical protein PDR5_02500 [Pseudomonas sp. DR 5-09]
MKLKLAFSPGLSGSEAPVETPTSLPESGRCTRRLRGSCGSGLAREGVVSGELMLPDTPSSRASPLPQKRSTLRSQRRN